MLDRGTQWLIGGALLLVGLYLLLKPKAAAGAPAGGYGSVPPPRAPGEGLGTAACIGGASYFGGPAGLVAGSQLCPAVGQDIAPIVDASVGAVSGVVRAAGGAAVDAIGGTETVVSDLYGGGKTVVGDVYNNLLAPPLEAAGSAIKTISLFGIEYPVDAAGNIIGGAISVGGKLIDGAETGVKDVGSAIGSGATSLWHALTPW